MWAVGSNSEGQLGVGHTRDRALLTRCVTEAGAAFPPAGWQVVRVACMATCTAVLCRDATQTAVWLSGRPPWEAPVTTAFRRMEEAKGVVDVAATWDCLYVVVRDEVWALGASNAYGQWGAGRDAPPGAWHRVQLPQGVCVRAIVGGVRHCAVAVDEGGRHVVYGWGQARHGELRHVPPTPPLVWYTPVVVHAWPAPHTSSLALGMHHTVIGVYARGETELVAYGSNRRGQLDVPRGGRAGRWIPACNWHTTLLWGDDVIEVYGARQHGQGVGPGVPCRGAVQLSSGSEHSAMLRDGCVYGWGWNEHGNVGGGGAAAAVGAPSVLARDAEGVWTGYGTTWVKLRA